MPKIIQLEQHVADLIAAGEVVSRPASVVKELVENSIDAGSTVITAEISRGGMAAIRVSDNGCGIAAEEAKTAFLRHATSKLQDATQLEAIGTLGFRGEALAAIAAVSRIELITRTADKDVGIRLLLEGGSPIELSPTGCPVGTTIIVRDLFFNTPARLKFMKSDRSEGSAVSSVMLRAALSRPDLSFRYIKDSKTEFHTPGDSKPDSCIYTLLGRDISSGLIPVELSDEAVTVKGYISAPSASRGNRSYQFFFVNGRTIRSQLLQSALEQAYKNSLMSGRFPSCCLYITAGFGSVDVNVHPAKTEVRFVSDKQFFDGVYYAALGALENVGSASPVHEYGAGAESHAEKSLLSGETPVAYSHKDTMPDYKPYSAGGVGSRAYRESSSNAAEYHFSYDDSRASNQSSPRLLHKEIAADDFHSEEMPLFEQPYRIVGEVFNAYIVVECHELVCFIDKHAAHERIHYNALSDGEYVPMSEMLLFPVVCRVGFDEASLLLDNANILDALGFTVESFGEDAVAVRHMPSDIRQSDVEAVIVDICRQLEFGGNAEPANLDKIHKIIACKAAIKAGSNSDIKELDALAARVMSGEVMHCPHGRPIVFEVSRSALEKNVGRT